MNQNQDAVVTMNPQCDGAREAVDSNGALAVVDEKGRIFRRKKSYRE